MQIMIVAEHGSFRMGGEASLPLHYFRLLRAAGLEAEMILHERCRDEVRALFPDDLARLHFLPEHPLNRLLWRLAWPLPDRLGYFTFGWLSRLLTQRAAAQHLRMRLSQRPGAWIIHQPIPVSPREPSALCHSGAPVIVGPMNGNIAWAPGFRPGLWDLSDRLVQRLLYTLAPLMNRLVPGKREAALLLSANARTSAALLSLQSPAPIVELPENGIDTALWQPQPMRREGPAEFLFMGRLVAFKGAQFLPEALAQMQDRTARLGIIGDGPLEAALRARVADLGLSARVRFYGFQSQEACAARLAGARALVLPSLAEAGGAVVLEAMACARPAIVADHGGPADYLVPGSGIKVPALSPEGLIQGLAAAMDRLAAEPDLAEAMGQTARAHVVRHYDWQSKIATVLRLYEDTLLAQK